MPPLVELTWYEPQWRPRAAERLALEVRLRRPRGFANPGGADYEARMLREGIGATGYVRLGDACRPRLAATLRGRPCWSRATGSREPTARARSAIGRPPASSRACRSDCRTR